MTNYLYGLDISMKCTGITVYDLNNKKVILIDSFNTEDIKATKEYKGYNLNALKLKKIIDWIKPIIKKYPPTFVSIERMFSRHNNETQVIAKTTGCIQVLLWNIPQYLYPPKKVKSYIIHGDATKEDVKNSIITNAKYNDLIFKNEDESDSFAVMLTFLIDHEILKWEKPNWTEIKKLREKREK